MKKLLLITLLFLFHCIGFGQVYTPMPVDNAIWRYRNYDIDFVTKVFDYILYVNGTDTVANGKTYQKIFIRQHIITVPNDSIPPDTSVTASVVDAYYAAMRDSNQQVYLLDGNGEDLMFDFNAAVGDSIPAYSGKDKVTAIDSVLLEGTYHRRFLTNDSTYYAIEGIGSNRGLIPSLNDGSGVVQFFCFTDTPVVYTPDSTIACTYVYPIWYTSVPNMQSSEKAEVEVSPVPACDVLHITTSEVAPVHIVIYNGIGQAVWNGDIIHQSAIPVASWVKGIYYLQCEKPGAAMVMKKLLIE